MACKIRAEKRKRPVRTQARVISTLILPLRTNARDAMILDQRLKAVGRLRNAALGSLLERAEAMRADERWADAGKLPPGPQKSDAYFALRKTHGVNPGDAVRIAFGHWHASKWMADVLDSRIAIALGREVLTSVDSWLFALSERPAFKPVAERTFVMGNDNKAGLRIKNSKLLWPTRIRRKALQIELDTSVLTQRRRVDFVQRRVLRVGIVREMAGATPRYFAHIMVEGPPFRDPAYLSSIPPTVGCIDVNVSNISVHGPAGHSLKIALYDDGTDVAAKAQAHYERRLQRRAERSRRAMNPHAFRADGVPIKGVRQNKRSKAGLRTETELRSAHRKRAAQQAQWQTRVARTILQVTGTSLAYEDVNFASWAIRRGYFCCGRRLRLTTPGAIQSRVLAEARLLGGTLTPLSLGLALSSRCICGARAKKTLAERSHHCAACGFGPVDRDLLSAFLGRQVVMGGWQDLEATPLVGQNRATALASCQAAGRTVVIPRTVRRPKAKQGVDPTLQAGRRRPKPTNPLVRKSLTDSTTRRSPCVVEVLQDGHRKHEASAVSAPVSQVDELFSHRPLRL